MNEALASRSQRRLLKDIAKASEVQQRRLETDKLSLKSGEGILAIIVSRAPDHSTGLSPKEQHRAFLEEADRLKHERLLDHQAVVRRPMAATGDIKMDFNDPEITDIIMIGHGSLGCLWADGGRYFDWHAAAKAATHLKQGKIEQRMCGNFPSKKTVVDGKEIEVLPHKYSVPLGTFAVSKLTNVIAAVGTIVDNIDPPDHLFQPVFSASSGAPEQIRLLNEKYREKPTIVVT